MFRERAAVPSDASMHRMRGAALIRRGFFGDD
jgi:hypothetical protein